MDVLTSNIAEEAVGTGEGVAESTAESTESFTQRLQNFFSKVGNSIKENNPFNKLPRNANLGIVAGSQALTSTNFGSDFMSAILIHMKDGKEKEILETVLGIVISLMASLAGAGAAGAVCAGPGLYQFKNIATPLKGLMAAQIAGGTAQFSGQTGQGITYLELAAAVEAQGITQAILTQLQALG